MSEMNGTSTLVNSTSMSNQTQVVNFALNGKLLNDEVEVMLSPSNASNSGLSLPIILVLIFIIASIVGIIVVSLFVMRRRFSTWRLNGSKSSPNDAENGGLTENKEEAAGDTVDAAIVIDKKTVVEEVKDEKLESEKVSDELKPTTVDTTNQTVEEKTGQVSPSSNSPLINDTEATESVETAAVKLTETETTEKTEEPLKKDESSKPPIEQVTSSSSLIVNVLNELSESVACKLAGDVSAPVDPEKEPLKTE